MMAWFFGRCKVLPGMLLSSGQVNVGAVLIAAENIALGVSLGHEVWVDQAQDAIATVTVATV